MANSPATTKSTTDCGRILKSATPIVTAITTCTKKAPAAPNHTESGFPRVARTSDANIVLSGSSPMKMTGKTAAMTASDTATRSATTGRAFGIELVQVLADAVAGAAFVGPAGEAFVDDRRVGLRMPAGPGDDAEHVGVELVHAAELVGRVHVRRGVRHAVVARARS